MKSVTHEAMQDLKTHLEKAFVALTSNESLYNIIYSKAGFMGTTWSCPDWLNGSSAREWLVQYEFFNHSMLVKNTEHHGHDDLIAVQFIRDLRGADVTAIFLGFIGNRQGDLTVEPNELDWLTMLLLTVDYLIEKED